MNIFQKCKFGVPRKAWTLCTQARREQLTQLWVVYKFLGGEIFQKWKAEMPRKAYIVHY